MKKPPLHLRIMLGMVLGVLCGIAFTQFEGGVQLVSDWIKPFGTIFINALKLIAMPLILGSLIKGVSDLKDISKLSLMGGRTIGIYIVTTVLAVSIGLLMVNTFRPGTSIAEETREELVATYSSDAAEKQAVAKKQKEAGPLQALVDLVPDNIFKATTENGNMLQVIFFALFFGIGLILIPPEKAKPVKDFFDAFNEVILKLIDLIMMAAPYGVFALLAALVVESPSLDLFRALGMYAITLLIGLALMIGVYSLYYYSMLKSNPASSFKALPLLSFWLSLRAPVRQHCPLPWKG